MHCHMSPLKRIFVRVRIDRPSVCVHCCWWQSCENGWIRPYVKTQRLSRTSVPTSSILKKVCVHLYGVLQRWMHQSTRICSWKSPCIISERSGPTEMIRGCWWSRASEHVMGWRIPAARSLDAALCLLQHSHRGSLCGYLAIRRAQSWETTAECDRPAS